MGGFMSYQRFRQRNGLMYRTQSADPYGWDSLSSEDKKQWDFRKEHPLTINMHTLCGDLNRMERDLVGDTALSNQDRDLLLQEIADATGVDIEDARKVLKYVFFEQL